MRRGRRRCVISHHAVQCTDKGPLDTQPPPEKLDECTRRYLASQACKTSIPIQAVRVTIAHHCSKPCDISATPRYLSFGVRSWPLGPAMIAFRTASILCKPSTESSHVRTRGPTLLLTAHFASALVSSFLPGCARLAAPSKRTFLCLCPSHGHSPLVGGGSQYALLPCVSPRASGMVASAPGDQLSPSCGRTPSSHET